MAFHEEDLLMGQNVKIQTVLMSNLNKFYQQKVSLQELKCSMHTDRQDKYNSCCLQLCYCA